MILIVAILSYLIGSIPFGLLITKSIGLGDIRNIGSGNIGATNVLRSGNKKAAAATLLLDALKGFLAVLIVRHFLHGHLVGLALIAVLLGHCFPIWLKFRGGKGVATYIGAVFGIAFPVGIIACGIWALTAKTSKISSASAIVMVVSLPFVTAILLGRGVFSPMLLSAFLIIFQHRSNLSRMIAGTEPTIGK